MMHAELKPQMFKATLLTALTVSIALTAATASHAQQRRTTRRTTTPVRRNYGLPSARVTTPQERRHAATHRGYTEGSGHDAFSKTPVDSTAELVAEVQQDARLRKLYAKHFNLSEDQVVGFISRSLIPYRLPKDTKVTTYGATTSGRIYPVKQTLKRGTRVWATRSGVPLLKWACSNPIFYRIPVYGGQPPATTSVNSGRRIASLPAHPIETAELMPMPALIPPIQPPVTSLVGASSASMADVISRSRPNLAPLLLLPLVGFVGHHGSHHDTPPPPAVPEAGTLAMFGAAALPALALLARRRRAKKD